MMKPREKELGIYFDDDFDSAARQVVEIAQKRSQADKWQWDIPMLILMETDGHQFLFNKILFKNYTY